MMYYDINDRALMTKLTRIDGTVFYVYNQWLSRHKIAYVMSVFRLFKNLNEPAGYMCSMSGATHTSYTYTPTLACA
jgi:hypothetical protein